MSMQGYKRRSVAPLNGALQEGVVKDGRYEIFIKSNGTKGKDWIKILKKKGFPVERSAQGVLNSPDFKVTSGKNIIIVIFNLDALKKIVGTSEFGNYVPATAEMACYLRDKISGPALKALRVETLAVGHDDPIVAFDGLPRVLVVRHNDRIKNLTSLSVREGKLHGVDGYAYVKTMKLAL